MHDQTMLMPNNHTINTIDNGDGTYNVEIMLIKIAANIKVIGQTWIRTFQQLGESCRQSCYPL